MFGSLVSRLKMNLGGDSIDALYRLLEVARRFLRRKATISELRAAVRECEKAAPTTTCDCGHEG